MPWKVWATRTPPLDTNGSTCTSSARLDSRSTGGRLHSWNDPVGSGCFLSPRAPWMAAARFGLTPIPRRVLPASLHVSLRITSISLACVPHFQLITVDGDVLGARELIRL